MKNNISSLVFVLTILFYFSMLNTFQSQIIFNDSSFFSAQTLNKIADGSGGGRNSFLGTPSSCFVGSCVFRVFHTGSAWEVQFSADGGITFPNVFYRNTSASLPNPPDLTLGTWVRVGGNGGLSLSGEVQSSLLLDTTPPTFENSTPSISAIQQTEFRMSFDIDEAGSVFYAVVPDGATAPSITQLKNGTDGTGAAAIKSGNANITTAPFVDNFSISGLLPNTAYDIYIVAEDDESTPNTQSTVTKLDITTKGLQQWYKANDGLVKNGADEVTAWTDQSSFATAATPEGAPLQTNFINFNPAVTFNDGASSPQFFRIDLNSLNNSDYNLIVVAKRINSNSGNFVLGTSPQSANKALHLGYSINTTLKLGHFGNDLNIANSNGFNAPEISPVILHGTLDTAVGKRLAELKRGTLSTGSDSSTTPLSGSTNGFMGLGFNGNNEFQGDIAEVIVYNSILSPSEIVKIYSYLAIKYGLTLDDTGGFEAGDYVASDGTTIFWDASENTTYYNDITVIAKDDANDLNQPKSKSEHSDAMLTIEKTGGITTDLNAIAAGNNNQTFAFSSANSPSGFETSDRIWKMQKTGSLDGITLSFDVPSNTGGLTDYQLLVKTTDADFTSGTTTYNASAISGNTITFNNVTTVNNAYFTIAQQLFEIVTLLPTDDAINVALNSNLEIAFSKNVIKGTGNIIIYNAAATSSNIVETIPVTSSNVTITNNTVTINPTNDLNYNQPYYVQISGTAFKDTNNDNFVGILDNTSWTFSAETNTAPTFVSSPVTSVNLGDSYSYSIITNDVDGDIVSVTAPTLPNWLSLSTVATTSTFVGNGNSGSVNSLVSGDGSEVEFESPTDIARDTNGNFFVTDGSKIRQITPAGFVTTFTGFANSGSADGPLATASFNDLDAITIAENGDMYLVDGHKIRKISGGMVTTLAGSTQGFNDGMGVAAQFDAPNGIAVDALGNVFVADRQNHRIRKITPSGLVSTFAGSGNSDHEDGTGVLAEFDGPTNLIFDADGNLIVTEFESIRKITPTGVVTTLAGFGASSNNGISFNEPQGIVIDSHGNFYISDTFNHKIRKITSTGSVSQLTGTNAGFANGDETTAQFNRPSGLTFGTDGNLYVADVFNNRIRKLTLSSEITGTPTASDSGNNPVVIQVVDGKVGGEEQRFSIAVLETIPPLATGFSPADNATNVTSTTILEITFDEDIFRGTGNIRIYDASDDTLLETIDVNSLAVSTPDNKAQISTTFTRIPEKEYYVQVDAGAFKDSSNNDFAGILDKTTWNFTIDSFFPSFLNSSTPNFIFAGDNANLTIPLVAGLNAKWYASPTGGSELNIINTILTDNSTYYVTADIGGGIESGRLQVNFKRVSDEIVNATARGRLSEVTNSLSLRTGSTPIWFTSASGGNPLASNTLLEENTYYLEEETLVTPTMKTSTNRVAVNFNLINTFIGNDSSFPTQWRRRSNWSRFQVPIPTEDVAIPSDKNAEISVFDGQAKNLTVEGTLTVKNGRLLEVNNLETIGTLLVESDNQISGVITVANIATGNITFVRKNIVQNEWNLFTPPVQGETVLNFAQNTQNDIRVNTTVTPNRYALGFYNDARATGTKWEYYTSNTLINTNLDLGRGYAFSRNSNGNFFFTGTLLNGNLDISIKANEWNAVGNSFLAYYPVNTGRGANFLSDNISKLGIPAVYIWDSSQNKYVSYSNLVSSDDLLLLPAQGFFVRGSTSNTVISLPKANRIFSNLSFDRGASKSAETEQIPYLKLYAQKEKNTVKTDVIFSPTATNGFDALEDIENFDGATFDINTHLVKDSEGKNFTVQSIAKNDSEHTIIPISLKGNKDDVIIFSVEKFDFPEEINVYLEDKIANTFIQLDEVDKKYTITLTKDSDGVGRFYVHTTSSVLNTIDQKPTYLNVYLAKNNVLKISGLGQNKTKVTLFDVLGKQVLTDEIIGLHNKDIELGNLPAALYIVKLENKEGSNTKKIIAE